MFGDPRYSVQMDFLQKWKLEICHLGNFELEITFIWIMRGGKYPLFLYFAFKNDLA